MKKMLQNLIKAVHKKIIESEKMNSNKTYIILGRIGWLFLVISTLYVLIQITLYNYFSPKEDLTNYIMPNIGYTYMALLILPVASIISLCSMRRRSVESRRAVDRCELTNLFSEAESIILPKN